MGRMAGRIFMCYRREPSRHAAGRLSSRIDERLGLDAVFIDVESTPIGLDFVDVIDDALAAVDVVLVVIDSLWLQATDSRGQRRLDNPDDYVVREILGALQRKIRIVPILLDGAEMPRAMEMPTLLQPLTRRGAFRVRHESFNADADRLADALATVLGIGPWRDGSRPSTQAKAIGALKSRDPTDDHREIAAGIAALAEPIGSTLGPSARVVRVVDHAGVPHEVDDPVAIARGLAVPEHQDRGAALMRDLVLRSRTQVGDGAATAAVIAAALVEGVLAALQRGRQPVALARGLGNAVKVVERALAEAAIPLQTKAQIAALATQVTGHEAIGELIAQAMDKVGVDGAVTVRESSDPGFELELYDDTRFDSACLSPHFITDSERGEAELEDPYILILDQRLSSAVELLPLLDTIVATGRPLLVIADDVEGEALATLVAKAARRTLRTAAVRAPDVGDERAALLGDIAVVTGGTVIGQGVGLPLAVADTAMLGRARNAYVRSDETRILDGDGHEDEIAGRIKRIRRKIEHCESDDQREKLLYRLGIVVAESALFSMGDYGTTSRRETAALTRRGVKVTVLAGGASQGLGGILPGGGSALIRAERAVVASNFSTADRFGAELLKTALAAPTRRIATSGGHDPDRAVEIIRQSPLGFTFDTLTGTSVRAFDAGIVDAHEVVRTSLVEAVALAQRFLTLI